MQQQRGSRALETASDVNVDAIRDHSFAPTTAAAAAAAVNNRPTSD